jgi:hypothetical protein
MFEENCNIPCETERVKEIQSLLGVNRSKVDTLVMLLGDLYKGLQPIMSKRIKSCDESKKLFGGSSDIGKIISETNNLLDSSLDTINEIIRSIEI